MTTQQILDKASITAFEADLHGLSIKQITELVDDKLGAMLQELYGSDGTDIPKFDEEHIQTLLDYENLRYMMESSRIQEEQPGVPLDEFLANMRDSEE